MGRFRVVIPFVLALAVVCGQTAGAPGRGAAAGAERLDFSGCFPVHPFEVCAEVSGVRHQVVAPNGVVVTGFTEISCFTITAFGEIVEERCQTEHNAGLTVEGFLRMIHDSGRFEFTDGDQTCSGRFLLQVANDRLVATKADLTCVSS